MCIETLHHLAFISILKIIDMVPYLRTSYAEVVGVLVVDDEVGQQGDHVHRESQRLAHHNKLKLQVKD